MDQIITYEIAPHRSGDAPVVRADAAKSINKLRFKTKLGNRKIAKTPGVGKAQNRGVIIRNNKVGT